MGGDGRHYPVMFKSSDAVKNTEDFCSNIALNRIFVFSTPVVPELEYMMPYVCVFIYKFYHIRSLWAFQRIEGLLPSAYKSIHIGVGRTVRGQLFWKSLHLGISDKFIVTDIF